MFTLTEIHIYNVKCLIIIEIKNKNYTSLYCVNTIIKIIYVIKIRNRKL